LNKAFSWGCSFEPIQKIYSGWCGSTKKDLSSSSVLLSWSPVSLGESGSGSFNSARELESWVSPLCDWYWSATLFYFLSVGDPSSVTAREVFVTQSDFFQVTPAMVWALAWSPLVGYFMS